MTIKKGELIPEEDFEKIAAETPEGAKHCDTSKDPDGEYSKKNNRLKKLKGLHALNFIIMTGKAMGKSDRQIAEEVGCHSDTIRRHRNQMRNSEYVQDVFKSLWDFVPAFKQSLGYLAAKGDAFTTVKFFEGMGIWKQTAEVTHKVPKAEMQQKMVDSMRDILGVNMARPVGRPKNRVDGLVEDRSGGSVDSADEG